MIVEMTKKQFNDAVRDFAETVSSADLERTTRFLLRECAKRNDINMAPINKLVSRAARANSARLASEQDW